MVFDDDDDGDEQTLVRPVAELMAEAAEGKQNPYLIVLSGKAVGRMFKLAPGEMLVGRSAACDIMLDDDGVSRKHARVICRPDGSVMILDLGSTNGTWVEGDRVDLHTLNDGDRIQIGSATILKYGYQDTVEEKFVSQLYESATQDGLTGVYNKRFFLDRLRQEYAWHRRHDKPLSLLLLDIDFFKHINDTYGHQAGDQVLKRLAAITDKQCRTEDVFARYGGEEFAAILRETEAKDGTILAERIRRNVEDTQFTHHNGREEVIVPVTVSVGVASLGPDMAGPEALIEATDQYLYRAKQSGRNCIRSSSFDR